MALGQWIRKGSTADPLVILVPVPVEADLLEHSDTRVVANLHDGPEGDIHRMREVPADEGFGDLGGER